MRHSLSAQKGWQSAYATSSSTSDEQTAPLDAVTAVDWPAEPAAIAAAESASHQPQPRHLQNLQCSVAAVAEHHPKHASCGVSSSCSEEHGLSDDEKATGLPRATGVNVATSSATSARGCAERPDGRMPTKRDRRARSFVSALPLPVRRVTRAHGRFADLASDSTPGSTLRRREGGGLVGQRARWPRRPLRWST